MSGEVVQTPKRFGSVSVFDQYNMLEKIKEWRLAGYSYRATAKKIQEVFNVKVTYTALYYFCVEHGLDGDMSGERAKTVNSYNELIDSLNITNKAIAVTQVALEEIENSINDNKFDVKNYSGVFSTLDKLLGRRESLLAEITYYQGLIYKYSKINQFMGVVQKIIIDEGGLTLWNKICKVLKDDMVLTELMKEIPKEEDKLAKKYTSKTLKGKKK